MGGDKKGLWYKIIISVWVILTVIVGHIAEMEKPFVGDADRWYILYKIMMWIVAIVVVAVMVYNIINYVRDDRWWSRK